MSIQKPSDHPTVKPPKVGVLLLNLGTPDSPDYWPMRRYLGEFLSDRRVIETSPLIWLPILQGIILNVRPQKSGANYRKIWDNEAGDSPLRVITRRQAEKLQTRLGEGVVVDFAMRYGNPSTETQIKALQAAGCTRILFCPLYPQYSATTTATANDSVFDALKALRGQPAIRTLPPYCDTPEYIAALSRSIADGVAALPFKPDVVLTSYHGMPIEYLLKGDPYYCECLKTTRLVRERLGWSEDYLRVTFQSRFGPDEWLQPYTDKTLMELGAAKKKVAILAPAFSVDCIETLEELAITGREQFVHAGGGHDDYAYIPCLNDSDGGMDMLEAVVRRELGGWI
ncbi:MAG: ferrochelatase [Devosia nanyangense]|uniref:Ferrochelatase n=1 Tax=Devosia nanyangense TaxID=1228055 RepID=A0A933L6D2_9HYPH|nr:ferrochelatase [Devosia nanyangense]